MELPAIKIPQIELPFDIPLLMHPPVDHFIIAIPVIVLLLEMINIIVKKRTIGVISFILLILTVVAAVAAYLTGNIDGKEAYPLLTEVAQGELKEHKLLGTYLMLASVVVLAFKLLSVMISRGLMKALYLLILILFVAGILKQGKEGGELVYKYGANVEKVQELDSELFDVKEELEELQEENKPAKTEEKEVAAEAVSVKIETKEETPAPTVPVETEVKEALAETTTEEVAAVKTEIKEETTTVATPVVSEVKETSIEAVAETTEEKEEVVESSETVSEIKEVPVEKAVIESVKEETKEISEEAVSSVEEKVEDIKVEVIPPVLETPQIATH